MPSEFDPILSVWQNQTIPDHQRGEISMEDIHRQATRLDRRVRNRNLAEYGAAAIVAISFSIIFFVHDHWLWQLSCVEIVLSALWIVLVIRSRGRSQAAASFELSTHAYLARYRKELQAQEKLLRSAWAWYALPFACGVLGLVVSMALVDPDVLRQVDFWVNVLFQLLVFGLVVFFNRIAAQKTRAQWEALR